MTGNPVRFIYIQSGHTCPEPIDPNAIYFDEGSKQIRVGNVVMADSVEPVDVSSYLTPYHVKDIAVIGDGQFISGAELNEDGTILFTTSDPVIGKGTSPQSETTELEPGSEFEVSSGTSVSGTTIYDNLVKFKLPAQITSIKLQKVDSGSSVLSLDAILSDRTTVSEEISFFGSAAFSDVAEFATAEQGEKADAAMPAVGGSATDAQIQLASDPVNDMDAATKRYVDRTVTDAIAEKGVVFSYRGESSTPITDGGREVPTIDGEPVDPVTGMHKGEVVTYDGKEFMWKGEAWQKFGDEGSYALKTIRVDGSDGLSGGGALTSDIVLSHGSTGTGQSESYSSSEGISVLSEVVVDKFGHVQAASTRDISSDISTYIDPIVESKVDAAIEDAIGEDVEPLVERVVQETVGDAIDEAIAESLQDYSTTSEMESAISDAKAEAISDAVSSATNSANEYTDQKVSGVNYQIVTLEQSLTSEIADAEQSAKDYTDEKIAELDIEHPEYSVVGSPDPDDVFQKIYQLTKDGVPVGDPINIPKPSGGGGGGTYTPGQGLDISGDTILHVNIGDGTDIAVANVEVDSQDSNKLIFTQHRLQRDTMGHLTSSSKVPGSTEFSILSEEGVRTLILEYVPTWMIEQADSSGNYVISPLSPRGEQTGNDIYFSGTAENPLTLEYSPIDSSIGRNQAAAWVGARIVAPDYVTSENLSQLLFDMDGNTGIGTDVRVDQSFEAAYDGIQDGRYYVDVWLPISDANAIQAASTHSTIYRSYTFHMDGHNSVTFTVELSPEYLEVSNPENVPDVSSFRIVNWERDNNF